MADLAPAETRTEPGADSRPGSGLVFVGASWQATYPAIQGFELLVGRDPSNTLHVEEQGVSRFHARFVCSEGRITVEDLGSKNGVCCGSERIAVGVRVPIPPAVVVRFGSVAAFLDPVVANVESRALDAGGRLGTAAKNAPASGTPPTNEIIALVAASRLPVLITGETGVGKEVLARRLHALSPRAARPFVPVHCGALPEGLVESELFGHVRGAFTGAIQNKVGLFELASGGTLFLDEFAELPLAAQAKLLRALETHEVQRVGGTCRTPIDVRILAATNVDIQEAIARGALRADLHFRVAGVSLHVPPLRERGAELPGLIRELLGELGGGRPSLSEAAWSLLLSHRWPGNVRELRYALERALVLSNGQTIHPHHLGLTSERPRLSLANDVRLVEERHVREALVMNGGNQSRTAQILGISRRTLLRKLDGLALPRPRKKAQ